MIERDVPSLRLRLPSRSRARRHRRTLDDSDPARPPARGAPEVSGFPALAPRDQPEYALEPAPSSARARDRHAGVLRRAPPTGAVRADRQGASPRPGAADAPGLGHGAHAPDEVTSPQAAAPMAGLARSVSTDPRRVCACRRIETVAYGRDERIEGALPGGVRLA